ncbi:MAG: hypothetical protein KGR46_07600 [Verrucomicrobia bacterium]|nr:hypothetical protein [Verrucomicrobiota bacterium]
MKTPRPYDEKGCRSLMCALVLSAVEDANIRTDYKLATRNAENLLHQQTAIEFLRSPLFRSFCTNFRLPADKILRAAFK